MTLVFKTSIYFIYLFEIFKFNGLLMSIFYENQRNVILQNDSSYVGFFSYLVTIYTWYFYMIRLGQGSSLHQRHLPSSSKPNKQRCKSLQIKTRPLNTHRTVNLPTKSRFIFIYLFQCLNFVSTEYTVIAEKIIKKLLDPTQVCEMVKVCPEK